MTVAVPERVFTAAGLDALPPLEMARKAEQVGVVKAGMSTANTFALSVLAGAFIALGAIFATTVTAGGVGRAVRSRCASSAGSRSRSA